MRDNRYLENRLFHIWETYFDDVARKNLVLIKFGKGSRRQLGSIKWANERSGIKSYMKGREDEYESQDDKRITIITITKFFQNEAVPEYVIDGTIAHELVHYAHGFHSPLSKVYKHPHAGKVVEKELQKRGLLEMYEKADAWLKENWKYFVPRKTVRRRKGLFIFLR